MGIKTNSKTIENNIGGKITAVKKKAVTILYKKIKVSGLLQRRIKIKLNFRKFFSGAKKKSTKFRIQIPLFGNFQILSALNSGRPASTRGEQEPVGRMCLLKKIFNLKTIIVLNSFLFICFLLTLSLFLYTKSYAGKIYPGVFVRDINLGGKSIDEAREIITQRLEEYNEDNIVLSYFGQGSPTYVADFYFDPSIGEYDEQGFSEQGEVKSQKIIEWNPKLEELGFSFYIDDILNDTYNIGREGKFWTDSKKQIKALILGQKVKIDYDLQEDVLDEYLKNIAAEFNKPPQNPTLVIKDGTIEIVPGKNGYTLSINKLKKEIRDTLENFQHEGITLTLENTSFKIKPEDLSDARNKTLAMLSSPLILKYDDKVFEIDRDKITSWIKFQEIESKNENSEIFFFDLQNKWVLDAQLDEQRLREFVESLASKINVSTLSRQVMESGGREVVLRQGRDGKKLNTDQVISDIKERIEKTDLGEREFDLPVEIEKAKVVKVTPSSYGIIPKSDEKYIDVSLSRQILTCFEGGKAQFSTLISSGVPKYPTPSGTFHIYAKSALTRMRWVYGPDHPDNYDLPNVPYAMFFSGDFSLHGTYWHSNFGHPMSHGCVNLPTSAAAWVWNWAPKETKVVVY